MPMSDGAAARGVVGRRHPLVADGHGVLVHAVLGPPQPGRARQQGGVRAGVTDAEVLGTQRAPRRGAPAEGHATCTSPGGRSEFLANTMPRGPGAHNVSHMGEV